MVTKEFMNKVRWAPEESMKGNINALDQIDEPDVVVHVFPFVETKGIQAVKQSLAGLGQGFSNIWLEWEEMISEGDNYAARYTMHMKHTGINPMFPIPPTGKDMTVKGSFFAHTRNGKDAEAFEYDDWLGFMQQLGMVPPIGQK